MLRGCFEGAPTFKGEFIFFLFLCVFGRPVIQSSPATSSTNYNTISDVILTVQNMVLKIVVVAVVVLVVVVVVVAVVVVVVAVVVVVVVAVVVVLAVAIAVVVVR